MGKKKKAAKALAKKVKKQKTVCKLAYAETKELKAAYKKELRKLEKKLRPHFEAFRAAKKSKKKACKKYKKLKAELDAFNAPAEVVTEIIQAAIPSSAPPIATMDDLTLIEGIGPKIEGLLKAAGINTFAQLARSSTDTLKQILTDAGPRFRMHNPTTWPQQAQLAANGDIESLKTLQDELKGGRFVE